LPGQFSAFVFVPGERILDNVSISYIGVWNVCVCAVDRGRMNFVRGSSENRLLCGDWTSRTYVNQIATKDVARYVAMPWGEHCECR